MKTLLVIPCYCESKRLPRFLPKLCQSIAKTTLPIEVQLVDDGSPPKEQLALSELAKSLQETFPFLRKPLLLPGNLGKGGAVRAGWNEGLEFELLAFVDADGAVPAEETIRFLEIVELSNSPRKIHIAARDPRSDRTLHRTWSRKVVAKLFNTLIHLRYGIRVSDTQCGLKAIPRAFFQTVQSQLKEDGYAFDLELILAAKRKGLDIETVPIDWDEIPGSSTNAKHALVFLKQILFRSL